MNEENLDVVNDRDEVTDQKPRHEIHRLGLKHRATHVLVLNARGDVFLQKRSLKKDCFPGAWDSSASGHLDSGEPYEACAARELREELGLETSRAPERLFKIDACAETGQEFVWVYRLRAEGPFRLHPDEIERGDWFDTGTIDRWVAAKPTEFASGFVLIWKEMRRRGLLPR